MVDALGEVGSAHMVDDDRRRQRIEEGDEVGELVRLEIDDDVPAELGDAFGDRDIGLARRRVDQPLDEIEAHAAHAGFVERLQFRIADGRLDRGDSAREAVCGLQRVDEGAIVGAVAGRLDDDVAREAEEIA